MSIATVKFSVILWGLAQVLKFTAWRHPAFRARLKERNLVAQLTARDEETGRWYEIRDGRVTSGAGRHPKPDVTLVVQERRGSAPRCSRRRSTGSTRSTPSRISSSRSTARRI